MLVFLLLKLAKIFVLDQTEAAYISFIEVSLKTSNVMAFQVIAGIDKQACFYQFALDQYSFLQDFQIIDNIAKYVLANFFDLVISGCHDNHNGI